MEIAIKFLFCPCRCSSYKLLPFLSFLREFFTILLVKYFSVEQKMFYYEFSEKAPL